MLRKYDTVAIPQAIALVAPACRTLAVNVCANETEDGWQTHVEFMPCLALQSVVEASFSRNRVEGRFDVPASIGEAVRGGWGTNGTFVRHDAIVADNDYGLCEASICLDGSNVVHQVVATPWPESEDAERLGPMIERLERDAIEKAKQSGMRKTVPASVVTVSLSPALETR